jgi:CRP-like cAMP-binding protein
MPRAHVSRFLLAQINEKPCSPQFSAATPKHLSSVVVLSPPHAPTAARLSPVRTRVVRVSPMLSVARAHAFPNNAVECLKNAQLFRGLSCTECSTIFSLAQQKYCSPREIICRQGDPVRAALVLTMGWVKINRVNRSGKEIILRVEGPGGVVAMQRDTEKLHSFTAQTIDPGWVLTWSGTFRELAESFPALQRNAAEWLAERLYLLEERFEELATQRVPQRLARILLRLLEHNGQGNRVPIDLSCEELSQMAGTTLFTVSRLLCDWAELGIIQAQRKTILVEDLPRLVELAEDSAMQGRLHDTRFSDI